MADGLAHRSALALLLAATAPCAAIAEPRPLADAEMDAVTAAGVTIEVDAHANALGRITSTRTDARAVTARLAEGVEIGAGFAEGQAFACCGEQASVAVGSSAAGSGGMAHGESVSHVFHGAALTDDGVLERFTFGYSAAWQVVSSEALLEPRALDGLARTLTGAGQTGSGDGLVTDYAFAPVYAAGLRWRVARRLAGQPRDLSYSATASRALQRLIQAHQAVRWQ